MRTEIFNPNNFQVNLRTNQDKDLIMIHILDLRMPAGTEVEPEETTTYGLTPMYYADDCCMVSPVYLALIVQETLRVNYPAYLYECQVHTAYSILPCSEVSEFWHKHHIRVCSGHVPAHWHQSHKEQFANLYRCVNHAIARLMHDLQYQTFHPNQSVCSYSIPYILTDDYEQAKWRQEGSIDGVWSRLRQLSDPNAVAGMRELNQMVGMTAFKAYLHQLICDVQLHKMRSLIGLRPEPHTPMHFVFTGNPGTGKTTAAKALGKALHEAGIISRGDVVYRDRSSLVGAHVGESENRVKELFEKDAPGNVVVIDEAYALTADTWSGDFGHRVVDSLMTYTADPKADYVVVLCGYRNEMSQMLASNSGLSSRFSLRFDFADYTHDELLEITHRTLTEMDYHFTPEAAAIYSDLLREVLSDHQPHFGNARWVKAAIHQHILVAQHRRLTQHLMRGSVQLSRALFSTIEHSDIAEVAHRLRHLNAVQTASTPTLRRIGFAA